jgi:signal transduction histidine kinase
MKRRHIGHVVAGVYRSLYFPPTVIFLAIIIATLFSWHSANSSLEQDVQAALRSKAATTENLIVSEMLSYEEILRGGVGLFRGSSEVTAQDWARYISAFDAKKNYPHVQSLAFAKVFTASEVPVVSEYMATQGVPNFAITPAEPPRDQYAAVVYAVQIASKTQPTFGFDLLSDPQRKRALSRARDTGETAMSGRLNLRVLDVAAASQNGFNLYTPYYDSEAPLTTAAERQAALRGYAVAGFRSQVFFTPIAAKTDSPNAGFKITVANDKAGKSLFESKYYQSVQDKADEIKVTRSLPLFGERWNIEYVFTRGGLVSQAQLRRPLSGLFGGIFIAFLIATIVLLLLRSRASELAIQKEKAVELAKDELLSLASHQLRTPATGVKQYVGMVLQGFAGKVPGEQRSLLEKAYASNDRQLQIINEILHLAKIGSGRIVLARQPTNLNDLIRDIIAEQEPDIEAAHHKITTELPKRPVIISADAHMLRMAIENILSNAIKYTHKGGQISIKLYKNWRNTYIRIVDNGVGIAESDQGELFKQFKRITNEMTQDVGGTGIGLFLAKSLVDQHGGTITVRSVPGKGSVFTIILPLEPPNL